MAVKGAKTFGGGGGRIANLKEILHDNDGQDVLAVFRILEFQPDEKGDHGYVCPVVAHMRILAVWDADERGWRTEGDPVGEVFQGKEEWPHKYAITSALRGVQNPSGKGNHSEPPENDPGDDIVTVLHLKNPDKSNETAFGNEPSSRDFDVAFASEWYDAKGEEFVWPDFESDDERPAREEKTSTRKAPEREKVGAGAGGGRTRPKW
jgi:hypothetical protein